MAKVYAWRLIQTWTARPDQAVNWQDMNQSPITPQANCFIQPCHALCWLELVLMSKFVSNPISLYQLCKF